MGELEAGVLDLAENGALEGDDAEEGGGVEGRARGQSTVDGRISSSVSEGKPSMKAPCTITPCLAMKSTMRSTFSILRFFFITFWMRAGWPTDRDHAAVHAGLLEQHDQLLVEDVAAEAVGSCVDRTDAEVRCKPGLPSHEGRSRSPRRSAMNL